MDLKNLDLDHFFSRQSRVTVVTIGSVLVVLLGVLDYFSSPELSLSVFYILPIFFVTWFAGYRYGIQISLASIAIWVVADFLIGRTYSHPFIIGWNILVRLSFFLITAFLLAQVKYIMSEREIARARRNGLPLTVAYLDLDDFKSINVQFGHHTGDRLLVSIVSVLKENLRSTDIFARSGEDEFTILFPESDDEAASVLLKKLDILLQSELQQVQPVGCSLGAVTYFRPPTSVDEILKDVYRLIYLSNMSGKDGCFLEIVFNPGYGEKQ